MTRLASLLLTILALATIDACVARAEVVSLDGTWQADDIAPNGVAAIDEIEIH